MYSEAFKMFDSIARKEAARLNPKGYDLAAANMAPATLADTVAYYNAHGRVCVSTDFSADMIYDDERGSTDFRAWHDMRHIMLNAEFDRVGEYAVFKQQCADIRAYDLAPDMLAAVVNILRAEIMGQFDYNETHGNYPQWQREFTIDYLEGRH